MKNVLKRFGAILLVGLAAVVATISAAVQTVAGFAADAVHTLKETGLRIVCGPQVSLTPTGDVAIKYRMGGGTPGDVNRTHPFSVLPCLMDAANPVLFYGDAVFIGTASNVRRVATGDGSATPGKLYGVAARPYPIQQTTGGMASSFGVAPVSSNQPLDVVRQGFVIVKLPAGAVVKKGDPVQVWAAASAGANVQGQFVAAASGTNTFTATNAIYNGPADADGNVEIEIWA